MIDVKPEVLRAFELMWGLHPGPVMLIHKGREILAVNQAAAALGLPVGILCHSLYPSDKPCPHCLANKALKQAQAVRRTAYVPTQKRFVDGFWIPVVGEPELYVHFGNDITEYVRPDLLPSAVE